MITTREEFKEYCLRALGKPVIQINVADSQVEDRIDDALTKYFDFHSNGTSLVYLKHRLTQDDIDNQYITVDDNISMITRVLMPNSMGSTLNLTYVAYISDVMQSIYSSTSGLQSYVTSQSYLNTMNDILNAQPSIEFVRYGNKLIFQGKQKTSNVGDFVVIECYIRNDPVEFTKTWNDSWLKRYSTALIKKQWANNLLKYNGATLPSGITINGDTILSEANRDIEQLEVELRDVWEVPVLGWMA